jgi:uncharacterized protein (DUF433 family)
MNKEYVTYKNGVYCVAESRVSLDSIVYGFQQGESPETIAKNFPTLTLEQVYGAVAFYLSHQSEIDDYIKQGEVEYEAARQKEREADPEFYEKMKQKLSQAREQEQTTLR